MDTELIKGAVCGNMAGLAAWTQWPDKVVVFCQ